MKTGTQYPRFPSAAAALRDLLEQLEGIGIYIPGEDEGQWAGTEGLSFAGAERAVAVAFPSKKP